MIIGQSWGMTGMPDCETGFLVLQREGIPQELKPDFVARLDVQAKAWTYPEAKTTAITAVGDSSESPKT